MEIRPGDLILVNGSGFIPDAIEKITHSSFSHVAGLVKPNELIEANGGRRTGYQALDLYAGCADVYTCDELTDEQRAKIVADVTAEVGKRYSYLLIGWEFIRYTLGVYLMPSKEWHPLICSVLWSDAYKRAGVDLCPGVFFPSPADIANSSKLRNIGKI